MKECDNNLSNCFDHNAHLLKEKIFLEELFDMNDNNKWIVRIVVCEIANRKKNYFFDNILSRFAKFGIVHTAIQVGPYLIDWIKNSEVRIRSIASDTAMLFLYPNSASNIDPLNEETRKKITDIIFNYRYTEYSLTHNNCQTFVDNFLTELNIKKTWSKFDCQPIREFIQEIKDGNVSLKEYQLSFNTLRSKKIHSHEDLKEFWVQLEIEFDKEQHKKIVEEMVELVKGLERGFMARGLCKDPIKFGKYLPEGELGKNNDITVYNNPNLLNRVKGDFRVTLYDG